MKIVDKSEIDISKLNDVSFTYKSESGDIKVKIDPKGRWLTVEKDNVTSIVTFDSNKKDNISE